MQDGKTTANASLTGGESEALQRLKRFAVECREQPIKLGKDGPGESIYGANFSCKISPWLATGCLSLLHDVRGKSATLPSITGYC